MSQEWQALGILLAVIAFSALHRAENQVHLHNLYFSFENKTLTIYHPQSARAVLAGQLAHEYSLSTGTTKCKDPGSDACVAWEDMTELRISYQQENNTECYQIQWLTTGDYNPRRPYDCFEVDHSHWYGGSEHYRDHWPMSGQLPLQAYVSKDVGLVNHSCGSVLERYWLSSSGVAILVDDTVPMLYSRNTSQMCIVADPEDSYYLNFKHKERRLSYHVCTGPNAKDLHLYMMAKHFKRPERLPDLRMMQQPIWSTWAKYKTDIDQNKTIEFAKEIAAHGFDGCQVEIDDKYTTAYGDFIFDPKKFPDPKSMTEKIHALGFRVTSWIMPFANPDSLAFKEGVERGYFVMDASGKTPGLIHWWQGFGAIVDFTNQEAVKWFAARLDKLKQQGIDSFKYDAGEIGFLPPYFSLNDSSLPNPNHYSRIYAEAMHKHTNDFMEVRVGYKSQHLPVFVRMLDKDSQWNFQRGLDTVIPTALLFGLLGYPFVLPDMIGGNAYNADGIQVEGGDLPSKELYIRWLTLNAFLPAMQFSICPWQYDQATSDLALKMVKLHQEYVTPRLVAAGKENLVSGAPIIRPMWWTAVDDPMSFAIGDQFLIGDSLLVAPVLKPSTFNRNIYLPVGQWKDQLTGKIFQVQEKGFILSDYKVSLEEIAYFERVNA